MEFLPRPLRSSQEAMGSGFSEKPLCLYFSILKELLCTLEYLRNWEREASS